ncbi:MAG: methylated-DNA--[protein]-cysteine S-methyltransferase [Actinomycetota bacterium]
MAGDLMASPRLMWSTITSPAGELIAVRSTSGIIRLGFVEDGADRLVQDAEEQTGLPAARDDRALMELRGEIDAYFSGSMSTFATASDLSGINGFARRVLDAARAIPFGAVATYGELATRAGSPRAQRAAGSAMRRNPVLLLVPCHRVVPADGSIGGYSGREDRKAFLLDHEAVVVGNADDDGRPGDPLPRLHRMATPDR